MIPEYHITVSQLSPLCPRLFSWLYCGFLVVINMIWYTDSCHTSMPTGNKTAFAQEFQYCMPSFRFSWSTNWGIQDQLLMVFAPETYFLFYHECPGGWIYLFGRIHNICYSKSISQCIASQTALRALFSWNWVQAQKHKQVKPINSCNFGSHRHKHNPPQCGKEIGAGWMYY